MPRKARQKAPECIYHIMCRSVSEFLLFRNDDDKDYYLGLLKRYTDKFRSKLYTYCLMDNHLHLQLDPSGFDVSKFMHSTNTAYVRYYNKKYNRHGHVFQERFESRILDSEQYNLAVSAYIHNNAKDIEGYRGREEDYKYSSYGIYLGKRKDTLGLIDKSFISSLFNAKNERTFIKRYFEFVTYQRDVGTNRKINEEFAKAVENQYRSERKVIIRDKLPSKVISYISERLMKYGKSSIMLKSKKKLLEYRAFCVYALRTLCGAGYREICENIHNITLSGCARLCDRGHELVHKNQQYEEIFEALMAGV